MRLRPCIWSHGDAHVGLCNMWLCMRLIARRLEWTWLDGHVVTWAQGHGAGPSTHQCCLEVCADERLEERSGLWGMG